MANAIINDTAAIAKACEALKIDQIRNDIAIGLQVALPEKWANIAVFGPQESLTAEQKADLEVYFIALGCLPSGF